MSAFVVMTRRASAPRHRAVDVDHGATPTDGGASRGAARTLTLRRAVRFGSIPFVLVIGTAAIIVAVGPRQIAATSSILVTDDACAPNWTAPASGRGTFEIANTSSRVVEIYLMDATRTTAYGEIEGLAPGTSRSLSVEIAEGSYVWRCVSPDGTESFAAVRRSVGPATGGSAGYRPATLAELEASTVLYRSKVTLMLDVLVSDTDSLASAVRQNGATPDTKRLWLQAHLDYTRLGAAYGTFGDFDAQIDGRPNGLPDGVLDPGFSGFLRLEHELWQAPPGADPAATATRLATDVRGLRAAFPTQETDPRDLPLRAHEILENGLQFELTGTTDQGSHTNLATLRAEIDATRIVLEAIRSPLTSRDPGRLTQVETELDRLAAILDRYRDQSGMWAALTDLTLAQREVVNGSVGQLVEDLAPIPDILELPPATT
jgi:high-affinity iron transporter